MGLVTNTGVGLLDVSGIAIAGTGAASFQVDVTSFTLAEDESRRVTVTYTNPGGQNHTAALQIVSNDPDETATRVPLQGNPATLQVGDDAIDFTLPGIDGQSYTLSDFEGRVVLLGFFASW